MIFNISDNGMVYYKIPLNLSGSVYIQAFAKDLTGNHRNMKSNVIFITDSIAPTIGPVQDFKIEVGETKTITIEANDNIEVALIEWSIDTLAGSGPNIEMSFEQPGNYILNITVIDTEGNVAYQEIGITVIDQEDVQKDPKLITALLIFSGIIILIILSVVIFFVVRRKKKEEDQENKNISDPVHNPIIDELLNKEE